MRIDLTGRAVRIDGVAGAIPDALRLRLADCGATFTANGVPDLMVLSCPLTDDPGFDWDGLASTARSLGSQMQARGTGRMLFLLPAVAGLPMRRAPDLSARGAAMLADMRVLTMSLAPAVAVNALGVGAIAGGVSGDAAMIGHASVGRAGTVDEVCAAALFLCDPLNTYLTGQFLCADGGWTAGYGRNF
jgi:NAD(P)-dependent dehydrogenase (short-subunit alcohol dehydrogenase family)